MFNIAYDYLSQNITTVLLIAAACLLMVWIAIIFRTLLGTMSLSIGLHNNTAIVLEDYTAEEVGQGLVPSSSDFSQLLRSLKSQRFPPRQMSTLTTPALLQKQSLHLDINDCTTSINIVIYWDVDKEELSQLSHETQPTMDKTPQPPVNKSFYEKLVSGTPTTNCSPIVVEEGISDFHRAYLLGSLPSHYTIKSETVRLEEGLKQHFVLHEGDRIPAEDLSKFVSHTNTFPLVVVMSPVEEKVEEENPVVICIFNIGQKESQDEQETEFYISLSNQYVLTSTHFHELQEVYGIDDEEECVICLTDPKNTTILPCNHFAVCSDCFDKVETCPICRTKINAFVRFYHENDHEHFESMEGKIDRVQEAEIEIVEQ